jgi:hypothetical protein
MAETGASGAIVKQANIKAESGPPRPRLNVCFVPNFRDLLTVTGA